MRRCVRCSCWKPDANFLKFDLAYMPGRCTHCRSILAEMKGSVGRGGRIIPTSLPHGPEKIEPTLAARALAMYGVAERAEFLARGGRRIPRTYVHDSRGSLIGKAATKKRYSGGFTSSTLGR